MSIGISSLIQMLKCRLSRNSHVYSYDRFLEALTKRPASAQEDIARIASAYHAWRGEEGAGDYEDVPGFCKSASLEEVSKHGCVLTPGRYVGAEVQEDDGEPFAEKMQRLTAQWREQQTEAVRLDEAIAANLAKLGFDGEGG